MRRLRPASPSLRSRPHAPRRPWAPAAVLALALGTAACTPAQESGGAAAAADGDPLEARVRARLDSLDAETAIYARHLPSGREVAVRADQVMNTLSVIKLGAMVRAYQRAEVGYLDLDARRTVEPEDIRGGSGLLQTFDTGVRPTVRDLITQMIITSDNTATDMVLEEVGGVGEVNRMLAARGFPETRFRMTTGEIFAALEERLEAARAAEGEAFDAERIVFDFEGDSTVWLGRSTPRETADLLVQILEAGLASEEHSEEMVGILRRQFYSSRLPRTLRGEVQVAHKTGDWPPHAGDDVGLIFYEGGPVVVAIYVNQNRGDFLDVERTMGVIAEDLVRAWDGADALR